MSLISTAAIEMSQRLFPVDDLDNLTDNDISDRIMDFRLGLRSDIT